MFTNFKLTYCAESKMPFLKVKKIFGGFFALVVPFSFTP